MPTDKTTKTEISTDSSETGMPVCIKIGNKVVSEIDPRVYELLKKNVFLNQSPELINGSVTYKNLKEASRKLNIPHTLFFADYDQLSKLLKERNKRIFGALDGRHIVASRGEILDIRVIAPIIQDVLAKQKIYNEYSRKKCPQKIIKYLASSNKSVAEQAKYITRKLGIDMREFRSKTNRREAFHYLRNRLSANQIHVFVEAKNYMPINIPNDVELSGFYIRNNAHPCIFITNELNEYPVEGMSRKMYTLLFLVVCIFKGVSYAVHIDKKSYECNYEKFKPALIHKIVGNILLSDEEVEQIEFDENGNFMEKYSLRYKISKTALLNRLQDRSLLSPETYRRLKLKAEEYFRQKAQELREKRKKKTKDKKGGGPRPKVMIEFYQGDFIRFLKVAVPERLRQRFFSKHVSYSRLKINLRDF